MDKLRWPFLVAAFILAILCVVIELGTGLATAVGVNGNPPGLGIPYLAMVDGVLAFTLGLMVVSLVVPESVIGRVQGCATLILAIVILLASIVLIFVAIALLLLMIGLLVSFFGAIIYFAVFGFFPRAEAAAILALLLTLKIAMAICLVIAHQRFIENTGLVVLVLLSLILNLVIAFLHDFLPRPFVSITDAVAGIIVAIVAIVWSILLLIGAVIAVIRALQPPAIETGEESSVRS